MKRFIVVLLTCFIFEGAWCQSAVQKTAKSVFTLTTFKADGTLNSSSHGVFVNAKGDAVSTWAPFVDADSAVVIDVDGNKYDIQGIYGANEIYDLCKFRVKGTPSHSAALSKRAATAGEKVFMAEYAKKPVVKPLSISKVETFGQKYAYYLFPEMDVENMEGSPVFNSKGELLGLLQKSSTAADVYSTDVNFIDTVTTTGLSVKDALLSKTGIQKMLPSKLDDASLMLIMAAETVDSAAYVKYVDAFIATYPSAIDGYQAKARCYMAADNYDMASAVMQKAVSNVANKDVAHSAYASLIYNKLIYKPKVEYSAWTADKALQEIAEAEKINDIPAYKHQEGQIYFIKGDYQKAYDIFCSLTKTNLHGGEVFYEAAQCKVQLKAPMTEVITLLDSAVAACPQPLDATGAPYVLARGLAYDEAGQYRKAVNDYNKYDTLMYGRCDADFYYTKYKCELKAHQYLQALNDIAHAAILSPSEPTYLAEMSSLQIRIGDFDKAVQAADLCIKVAPEYADAYLLKGLAQIKKNEKKEGLANLEKAKELGDERAQGLIDKYK